MRLKFDDVEKRAPRVSRKDRGTGEIKKKRKRKDYLDPDFDSEVEYGSEVEQEEDGSDVEYDDGKMSGDEGKDVGSDDGELSDEADLLGADDSEDFDEEGEDEMSSELEEEPVAATKPESAVKAPTEDYMFEKEEEDQAMSKTGKKGKAAKPVEEERVFEDRYRMDPLLVRRESTLLLLCLKSFKKRVIIFFNEKKQCGRLHSLFAFFGLKSVEVHGDLTQEQRLDNVEAFQRGDVDYLLATDLVARGLDISAVKAVLNFSFPTEPKRYLHRVGRTARAGSHGQAVTLCNDEERKDIKKLIRKLNQKLLPYTIPHKLVQLAHKFISETLDPLMRELQLEEQQDKEIERAYKEASRAENMIKYKDEIMSRPKTEWHKSFKEKKDLQKESKKDLKSLGTKFDESLAEQSKT